MYVADFFAQPFGPLLYIMQKLVQRNSTIVHPLALVNRSTRATSQMCRTPSFRPGLLQTLNFTHGLDLSFEDCGVKEIFENRHDRLESRFVFKHRRNDSFCYRLTEHVKLEFCGRVVQVIYRKDAREFHSRLVLADRLSRVEFTGTKSSLEVVIEAIEGTPWPIVPPNCSFCIERVYYDAAHRYRLDTEKIHCNAVATWDDASIYDYSNLCRGQRCYILLELLRAIKEFVQTTVVA